MSLQTPLDLADVLLKRHECLRTLGNQPQAKPELQLTLLGQYTFDHHARYKEGLESLTDATPVIKELPRDTPVERRFLIDAEIHVATAPVPDEVMQVFLDAVESATHVRSITPLAMAGYVDSFYRAATTGSDAQLEAVLPLETFERLRTLHPDSTDRAMADDDITLYHGDIPVTFSLWIADDDHAGLIVYADQGVQGILINDTDDALDWATNQYDRIQKDAEPIFYRGSARRNAGFS